MKRNSVRTLTIIFLCVIPVWMIICKDIVFSPKENRKLAQFPKVTWQSIVNGDFMDDFETYLADQFPIRDWCISVKTTALRITGKRLINDVYISDDGYLIAKESLVDNGKIIELTNSMNEFAEAMEGVKVNFMLVPNASLVYEDKLPYGMKSDEDTTIKLIRDRMTDKVNYIDVVPTLLDHKDDGLFYKTDHHWTTRGAYYAFYEYAKQMDISPVQYEFYNVANTFQGTQASNSGIYSTYENVEICVPNRSAGNYVVRYLDNNLKTASLFFKDKLDEKDKYQVFLGGNYAQVEITTDAGTGKNLMIVKDSYANCMIPMLTPYYDKIIIIDPRYFYDDIREIIKINKVNEVLFLYNVNSFVEDNSLVDVLNKKQS